jgi:hypothetical protein
MSRISWELAFVDLAWVPGVDEELEGAAEGLNAAREAA